VNEAPSLLDYLENLAETAGETGRRRALAAVAENDRAWLEVALGAIAELAATGQDFSAEEIRARASAGPSTGSMGAAFKLAVAARLIVRVGYRPSKFPSRHGAVVAVWRGRSREGPP
jgi:hypothetical protein